jgi:hypothetical protein
VINEDNISMVGGDNIHSNLMIYSNKSIYLQQTFHSYFLFFFYVVFSFSVSLYMDCVDPKSF